MPENITAVVYDIYFYLCDLKSYSACQPKIQEKKASCFEYPLEGKVGINKLIKIKLKLIYANIF